MSTAKRGPCQLPRRNFIADFGRHVAREDRRASVDGEDHIPATRPRGPASCGRPSGVGWCVGYRVCPPPQLPPPRLKGGSPSRAGLYFESPWVVGSSNLVIDPDKRQDAQVMCSYACAIGTILSPIQGKSLPQSVRPNASKGRPVYFWAYCSQSPIIFGNGLLFQLKMGGIQFHRRQCGRCTRIHQDNQTTASPQFNA